MEGLLNKNRKTVYSKILKRLVPKPWASLPVTLKKTPLVVTLDGKQLKAVEKACKVSWMKWFGAGWAARSGNLADSLSKWHWLSWQHEKNMYPEEGKDGYERPADAKTLEVECLGGLVEDLDDAGGDPEYDAALDGVEGAPLTTKDVAFVKAARDAVGETVDGDALAALEATATASDDDARSVAAAADTGGAETMDLDDTAGEGVLTPERAATMSCYDLLNLPGAWALVAAKRGRGACKKCRDARSKNKPHWARKCFEKAVAPTGRRTTRPHIQTGSTVEFETVPACNLVMDPETGLRPDGDTCWYCWRAVYHESGFNGHHAFIGADATPFPRCLRHESGTPYSRKVHSAHVKLDYLEKSRAAGNR